MQYQIDIPKVRGKMAEKGYGIESLATELKVTRTTMASYLKTPEKVPYRVIAKMATILCDSDEEARNIFFAPCLRDT